jgi:hypothetical protein
MRTATLAERSKRAHMLPTVGVAVEHAGWCDAGWSSHGAHRGKLHREKKTVTFHGTEILDWPKTHTTSRQGREVNVVKKPEFPYQPFTRKRNKRWFFSIEKKVITSGSHFHLTKLADTLQKLGTRPDWSRGAFRRFESFGESCFVVHNHKSYLYLLCCCSSMALLSFDCELRLEKIHTTVLSVLVCRVTARRWAKQKPVRCTGSDLDCQVSFGFPCCRIAHRLSFRKSQQTKQRRGWQQQQQMWQLKWVVVLIENQPDQCDVRQEQTKFASIHTPKQNSWFCRLLNCRGLLAQAASCALLLLRWPQQQNALRQSVAAPCGWTRMADWLDVHHDQADCDWRELLLLLCG